LEYCLITIAFEAVIIVAAYDKVLLNPFV